MLFFKDVDMFMKKTNLDLSTKQQVKNGGLLLEVLDAD